MPTEFDATRYAARLGVRWEDWPEFYRGKTLYRCAGCGKSVAHHGNTLIGRKWGCRECCLHWTTSRVYTCTLPLPYSDNPRACIWEPFLMRALGGLYAYAIYGESTTPDEWRKKMADAWQAALDAKEVK